MSDSPALAVTINGVEHVIRFADFTALESRDFRREMGIGLAAAFADTPDLDTIAGIVWLHRRKDNPGLTFEAVAGELTYDNFDVDIDGGVDDDGGDDPEG